MCAAASVAGEAVESDRDEDDEDEVIFSNEAAAHGSMVKGEAPESDEEQTVSVASSVATHFDTNDASSSLSDSLLHRKLVECNISFYTNLTSTLKNAVSTSLIQLQTIDKQLLKSQIRLQKANVILKNLESTSMQFSERLSIAACSSYIPKISIPLPEPYPD